MAAVLLLEAGTDAEKLVTGAARVNSKNEAAHDILEMAIVKSLEYRSNQTDMKSKDKRTKPARV